MHRICFTSCAHGMFLPTGSTPALPRDESKLHTTHTADAACGLWSSPTTCGHRRNSVPPLGTRAWPERHSLRMRLACSRRRRRTDGVDHFRHAPRQPQRTMAYACHPRSSSCEACACSHHGVWLELP